MYVLPINGVIGEDVTTSDILLHLNAAKDEPVIKLLIDSIGGDFDEGKKMIEALKNSGKSFVSENSGDVASMAVSFFLLGSTRTFDPVKGQFLIHNPWGEFKGDSDYLAEASKYLLGAEKELSKEYAAVTGTDENIIKEFMNIDKPLTPEQVTELNFAKAPESVEFKAVAKININNMSKQNEEIGALKALVKGLSEKFDAFKRVKCLMLNDSSGVELVFPDLEDGATPAVGDKATVDGSPADGEYVMPSAETYKFEGGELKEVVPEETGDDVEALKAENESLKQQLAEVSAKIEAEASAKAEIEAEVSAKTKALEDLNKEFDGIKAKVESIDFEGLKKDPTAGGGTEKITGYKRN